MCFGMGCVYEDHYTGKCRKPRGVECPMSREEEFDEGAQRKVEVLEKLTGIQIEDTYQLENIENYLESVGVDLGCLYDSTELPSENLCNECSECHFNEIRDLPKIEWEEIAQGKIM